jgi:hypothetical protein
MKHGNLKSDLKLLFFKDKYQVFLWVFFILSYYFLYDDLSTKGTVHILTVVFLVIATVGVFLSCKEFITHRN